jgi:hypothetical protein
MVSVKLAPVTNRETWTDTFSLIDSVTGDPYDLTDVTAVVFEVRDASQGCCTVLSASIGNGVTIEDDDIGSFISIRFETSSMRQLCAKQYEFGLVISKDGDDIEIVGTIPIVDGIVA